MNTKIIISLSIIGAVAAMAIGGTVAYFSDTETSQGNTITAGIVDIVVDDQNPWSETYSEILEDMKPCQTRYIEFTIRNLKDSNEVDIWKRINIVSQEDGTITEPECTDSGGTWTGGGAVCTVPENCCTDYTARNNLAAYTIYDMYVCADPSDIRCLTDEDGKPVDEENWQVKIDENQFVRLDNIDGAWIYLGQLSPTKELKVVQSYHLRSWPDAPEPEVTNWAQGDILTFDIDLYAEQLEGPGPKGATALLNLDNKDPKTWEPIDDNIGGQLTYNTSGLTFDFDFIGTVALASTNYCLIYYADPWPGDGIIHSTGMDIVCGTSESNGSLALSGNIDLGTDLPNPDDQNAPVGAKLQIVLEADYDKTNNKMTGWNPSDYLFEMNLISFDDN